MIYSGRCRTQFYVQLVYKAKLYTLEIKPCRLGFSIWDVEAFLYKTEIKTIYLVPMCLIVLIVSDQKSSIKNLGSG